ncbi:monocarboxylate transporter 12 [Lingula anatina]|uniref:Monocarboxylate transporter 12 n=1 Tax=Lingula anatina TaxID=7574 RepID=A0A1S3I6K6_LINAN|nr:monocarboxylate transporter 12 [Lingula anatina]|eukprot:XP_013393838.1 monocarboxylate transporter 12 [Lingula anatina]
MEQEQKNTAVNVATVDTNDSKVDQEDAEVDRDDLIIPPDGGWGWVVVFSSFLIHILADGIVYSFGIFYVEFLEDFKGSKGETAWVGSLVPGITLLTGPVASAFTSKYGCRVTTIAGAALAAVGFIVSIFSPNLYMLYFTFGIVGGLGFGLIYLPAIVSVGFYFEKRRAFATGLAVCGSGLGTFIFAPFSTELVHEYGWRGAVLIQAGLILNCILCGAVFRPLYSAREQREMREARIEKRLRKKLGKIDKDGDVKAATVKNGQGSAQKPLLRSRSTASESHTVTVQTPLPPSMIKSESDIRSGNVIVEDPRSPSVVRSLSHLGFKPHHTVMQRKDVLYVGSLRNIPLYRSNVSVYQASVLSIPHVVPPSETDEPVGFCTQMKDSFLEMMDFTLLKDWVFIIFAISNFLTSIGFNAPFIYIPDRALQEGYDEHSAAWLLSGVGIGNTVGRIVFGLMSDWKWVNRLWLYNITLTICGVATVFSSFMKSYPLMMVYACTFGCFIGAYVGLTSVILVDLLGLERLTSSFGLVLMFQGIATLIGPPIVGWVFDGTNSYDIAFYITGSMVALSGMMLFVIPQVQRWQDKKRGVTKKEIEMGKIVSPDQPITPEAQSV